MRGIVIPLEFKAFNSELIAGFNYYSGGKQSFRLFRPNLSMETFDTFSQNNEVAVFENEAIVVGVGVDPYWPKRVVTKVDFDSGDKNLIAVGEYSSGLGHAFHHCDVNQNKYVAIGWNNLLAVADLSGDFVQPGVVFTITGDNVTDDDSITLTWDADDNQDSLDFYEIYKISGGTQVLIDTITDTTITNIEYTFDEGTAQKITFKVVVYDIAGNSNFDTVVFNLSIPFEFTEFTTDKAGVRIGEDLSFTWQVDQEDMGRKYSVYKRKIGSSQWVQYFEAIGETDKTIKVEGFVGEYEFKIESGDKSMELSHTIVVEGEMVAFDHGKFFPKDKIWHVGVPQTTFVWGIDPGPSGVVTYDLYVKGQGETDFTKIATTNDTSYPYTFNADTNVFSWKVQTNYNGIEVESDVYEIQVIELVSPSLNSFDLHDNHTDDPYVSLYFDAVENVDEYLVFKQSSTGTLEEFSVVNGNSFTDHTVEYGEQYGYAISSKKGDLRSEVGSYTEISIEILEIKKISIANDNHTLLETNSVTVDFAPEPSVCYENYEVMLGTDPDAMDLFSRTRQRQILIGPLDYNTTFYLRIYGLDYKNDRVTGIPASLVFVTPASSFPVAPSTLSAILDGIDVKLSWNDNSGNETGFKVERKIGVDGTFGQIATTKSSTFIDSGIQKGNTSYYYRVRAFNTSGNSEYSNVVAVDVPNHPPSIVSTAPTSVFEDQMYLYNIFGVDQDGDVLTYSTTLKPADMELDPATGKLLWTPINSDVGDRLITIKVSDGVLEDQQSFTVNVINTNDSPEIISAYPVNQAVTVESGVSVQFVVIATDPDPNTNLSYEWHLDNGLKGTDSFFDYKPNYQALGTHTLYVKVSDGSFSVKRQWLITVQDTTKPSVTNVSLAPASPVNPGVVDFVITFSESMNTAVAPTVTFGNATPYNQNVITGAFTDSTHWEGEKHVDTEDEGVNTISISGATDSNGKEMDVDTSRTFTVNRVFADISIQKTVSDLNPDVGDQVIFTVVVTNNGPGDATGLKIKDILHAGLSYVSDDSGGYYDSATGVWHIGDFSATPQNNTISLNITATVTEKGKILNIGGVMACKAIDPYLFDNSSALLLNGGNQADLAVKSSVDNPNPHIGDTITFMIRISNNGIDNATGVVLTNVLPADLTYQSSVPSQGTYDSVTGVWDAGTLVKGESVSLDLVAEVNSVDALINISTITHCDQKDPDITNNSASRMLNQDMENHPLIVDLAIQNMANRNRIDVGDDVTFTVVVRNNGPDDATNVEAGVVLSAGLTLSTLHPSEGIYDDQTGIWSIGEIPNGSYVVMDVVAKVSETGPHTNITSLRDVDGFELDNLNNSSSVTVSGKAADMSVEKSVDDDKPNLGENVIFTITATNNGPDDAIGVQVKDQLPVGLTYEGDDSGGAYDPVTGLWSVGDLLNGVSATINITVMAAKGGILRNSATRMASIPADTNEDNDTGTVTISINQLPEIEQDGPLPAVMDEDGAPTPWSGPKLTATAIDTDALTWTLSSSPAHGIAKVNGSGKAPATFSYSPTSNFNGSDNFEVQVADGNENTDTITINVTIAPVNDAPSFTRGNDQTVNDNAGAQTIEGWATGISAGPANESNQSLTFNVSTNNDGLFSSTPSIDVTTGALTFTPKQDVGGIAEISVTLTDDAGTQNGGIDSCEPQTFRITVTYTPQDSTAPTPDPMTFGTQPNAANATSLSMAATTATDGNNPPVSYSFDFVDSPTGGSGGSDSEWQSSTSYADSGLQPNHRYGYRVKARDSASTPNETAYSGTIYKYTHAKVPGKSAFSGVTKDSIRANWTTNGNRSGTEYYCENTTKGTNSKWITNAYWTDAGLTAKAEYSFRVKARNGDGIETGWTNLGTQETPIGDMAQFTIDGIATQIAGISFPITITAKDATGNIVTTFNNTVDITSTGKLLAGGGTTQPFTNGTLTHRVIIGNTGAFTLTVRSNGKTGTSNRFTVNPGTLSNFLVEAAGGGLIGVQTVGTAFTIRLTARDNNMNTVTGFTGTASVSYKKTRSMMRGTTAAFKNGVLASHGVTITEPGTYSITATKTGGAEKGTGKAFEVKPETDAGAPKIFSVLVSGTSDSEATITWKTDEPSTSRVDFGTTSSLGSAEEDNSLAGKHSVRITGLTASTTYYFRVVSEDNSGNSGSSRISTFITKEEPDVSAPVITNGPLLDSFAMTHNSAVAVWRTDEPSTSVVELNISGNIKTFSKSDLTTHHRVNIEGLSAFTQYSYRVSSSDAAGNGPQTTGADKNPTDYVEFKTRRAPDAAPPVIIDGPDIVYVSDDRAVVTWTTDEPSTSSVNFGIGDANERSVLDETLVIKHELILTHLVHGSDYVYKVASTDKSGNTVDPPDSFSTAEAPDTAWPTITDGPSVAYLSEDTAIITWTTDEISNSEVKYGTSSLDSLANDSSFVASHSLALANLLPNTEYHYKVSSTDPSGNGPQETGTLSFTTKQAPDATAPDISGVSVSTTVNSAIITWQTSEPADGLVAYGGDSLTKGSIDYEEAHALTLTNLDAGPYNYQLSSEDPAGNRSTFSGSFDIEAVVAPIVTTGPATSMTADSATLNGTVNPNGVDSNYYFQYGQSVSYGLITSATDVLSNSDTVSVNVIVTGLEAGSEYHCRLVGVSSAGTSYGGNRSFKTDYASVVFVNREDGTCGRRNPCRTSIQAAIDVASTGAAIKITGGTYTEPFTLNELKRLTLSGRWNNEFSEQTAGTTKIKAPTTTQGSLILQNVNIIP